jgi:hypothetical protein
MVNTVSIPTLTDIEETRFWEKVEVTGFCWNWTAGKCKQGYGGFNAGNPRRKLQAHRVSYATLVGVIPQGLEVDHLCRNTSCVNPDHLEPVTGEVNRRRMFPVMPWAITGKDKTGYCKHGHEYTEDNTYYYKDGRTDCRTCKANRRPSPRVRAA